MARVALRRCHGLAKVGLPFRHRRWTIATPAPRPLRRNQAITAPEVRVVDTDGNQLGILPRLQTLLVAEEAGLDLVEIQPNATPPVCRVVDFGKYRFELQKKEHAQRRSQHRTELKEIQIRPTIGSSDLAIKVRHIHEFLAAGNRVKVVVRFRGRELSHPEIAKSLVAGVIEGLPAGCSVEQPPRQEGKQMVLVLKP